MGSRATSKAFLCLNFFDNVMQVFFRSFKRSAETFDSLCTRQPEHQYPGDPDGCPVGILHEFFLINPCGCVTALFWFSTSSSMASSSDANRESDEAV